jgi:glycosyltransferase involved in cell wall biosynthesis
MDAKALKPRILLFSKLFWPEGGGGELATYLIIRDVLSKYFDVTVVSGTKAPEQDILGSVGYIYWSVLETRYKPIEWIKLLANINWLRRLVEKTDIVYVPSHTLIPVSIPLKIIKPSIKIVLHLHNYQILAYTSVVLAGKEPDMAMDMIVEHGEHKSLIRTLLTGLGHYINYINRLAIRFVDKIICVSHRQYEILTKYVPEIRDKAYVIYNPPPPMLTINKRISEEPTLIYAGGGSYIKGFIILLSAIVKILKRYKHRIYITYGREISSQEISLLEKLSKKLDNKVMLLGRLSHKEHLKLHEDAWGLLFPSISEEPLPYAIVESLLTGTIPIASKVGGIPEIIKGTPAENFLFTPGDIDEFISKIEMLISLSKDNVENISIRLREHVPRIFDEKSIKSNLTSLFESVVH